MKIYANKIEVLIGDNMTDENKVIEQKVARDILSIITDIYFSRRYFEHRISCGSDGTRDLIIKAIKDRYDI